MLKKRQIKIINQLKLIVVKKIADFKIIIKLFKIICHFVKKKKFKKYNEMKAAKILICSKMNSCITLRTYKINI